MREGDNGRGREGVRKERMGDRGESLRNRQKSTLVIIEKKW